MNKIWDKIKKALFESHGIATIGLADIGGNAISAIFWFYVAALVGADHYGQISYYLALAGIVSSLSLVGASNTLYVYTAKNVKIHASLYFISLSVGIVSSTILFVLFHNIGLSIVTIGYVIYNLSISGLLGSKSYKDYSKNVITQKILMIILAIGLYYLLGINGIVLGIGLSLLPYITRIYKGFKEQKIDFSIIRERSGFIVNSYFSEIASSFTSSLDKLIVAPLLGFVILGNYQLAIQFLTMLYIIPNIFFKYFLPQEASGYPTKNLKKIAILTSVFLAIAGITLSPYVLPIFFPKFIHAVTVLQIVSIAVIPNTINLTFISKILSVEKSKIVLIGSIIYIIVQVSTIIILGKFYGVIGIAIALVLAETVQTSFFAIMNRFGRI